MTVPLTAGSVNGQNAAAAGAVSATVGGALPTGAAPSGLAAFFAQLVGSLAAVGGGVPSAADGALPEGALPLGVAPEGLGLAGLSETEKATLLQALKALQDGALTQAQQQELDLLTAQLTGAAAPADGVAAAKSSPEGVGAPPLAKLLAALRQAQHTAATDERVAGLEGAFEPPAAMETATSAPAKYMRTAWAVSDKRQAASDDILGAVLGGGTLVADSTAATAACVMSASLTGTALSPVPVLAPVGGAVGDGVAMGADGAPVVADEPSQVLDSLVRTQGQPVRAEDVLHKDGAVSAVAADNAVLAADGRTVDSLQGVGRAAEGVFGAEAPSLPLGGVPVDSSAAAAGVPLWEQHGVGESVRGLRLKGRVLRVDEVMPQAGGRAVMRWLPEGLNSATVPVPQSALDGPFEGVVAPVTADAAAALAGSGGAVVDPALLAAGQGGNAAANGQGGGGVNGHGKSEFEHALSVLAKQAEVASQVNVHIKNLADKSGGEVRMMLNPPELGLIHIQMHIQDGVVSGHISVQSAEVLDQLARDLRSLEQGLADAGLQLGANGLTFLLQDNGSAGTGGFAQGQRDAEGNQGLSASRAVADEATLAEDAKAGTWVKADSLLDVSI